MNKNVLKSFETAPGIYSEPTMVQLFQALWDQGYTGATVIHWLHGRPQLVSFVPEAVTIKMETMKPKPYREPKSDIRPAKAPWNAIR